MNEKIQKICIDSSASVLTALKKMDAVSRKLLLIMTNEQYAGVLSIGDIQRAIIAGVELDRPVAGIMRQHPTVASVQDDRERIKQYIAEHNNEFMPIVDERGQLADVLFREECIAGGQERKREQFSLPVIIMAGGKGTRLKPLTNVLPKPLIPIGKQTIIEDIMDRFVAYGCHSFYISINYKADVIRRYMSELNNPVYQLHFFQEDKPLGTAGSLHLLKDKIDSTFFVSNCDILIDDDYGEILKYHRANHNEITLVAAMKSLEIPYGTLETKEEGLLSSIREKPELTFKINTGMYIIEPNILDDIPAGEFYHITQLIEKLLSQGRRVGVYPISEGSWKDVGNWEEYLHLVRANE